MSARWPATWARRSASAGTSRRCAAPGSARSRLELARTLDDLAGLDDPVAVPLAAAVRAAFPVREIDTAEARELSFGRSLPARGIVGVHGAFLPDGSAVALLRESDGAARPVLVFVAAG